MMSCRDRRTISGHHILPKEHTLPPHTHLLLEHTLKRIVLEACVVDDSLHLCWGEGLCDGVLLTVEHPNGQLKNEGWRGGGWGGRGGGKETHFESCEGVTHNSNTTCPSHGHTSFSLTMTDVMLGDRLSTCLRSRLAANLTALLGKEGGVEGGERWEVVGRGDMGREGGRDGRGVGLGCSC